MYVHRVKRVVFSLFGGLGGDFCKDTHEERLFGMHGRRFCLMWTSHGSHPFRSYIIPNLCLGSKMSMVKNDVFSMVGGLGGDFYKDIYEPKLFGMHSGSVLSGLDGCRKCEYRA